MADVVRKIELQVTATDNASGVVANAGKKMKKALEDASAPIYGPANQTARSASRSADEQRLRDREAGQLQAQRAAARRAEENKIIEQRMRDREAERAFLAGDTGVGTGPGGSGRSPRPPGGGGGGSRGGGGSSGGGGGSRGGSGFRLEDRVNLGIGKFASEGAAAVVAMAAVGRALQHLPEAVEAYRAALKTGATPLQAASEQLGKTLADSVPIAGDLGKGLRSLWDFLGGQMDDARREDEQKARKAEEAARSAEILRRRERMEGIAGRLNESTRSAADQAEVEGIANPAARQRKQAEIDRRNRMSEIDKTVADAKSKPGDATPVLKAAEAARAQAEADYMASLQAANKQEHDLKLRAWEEEARIRRDHDNKMADQAAEAHVRELEGLGMYHTARLQAVRDAEAQERRSADQAYDDEVKRINEQGIDVANLTAAALKRREDARAAAAVKAKSARDAENREEEQAVRNREQTQARAMSDSRQKIAEGALRLAGRNQEADQLARKYAHDQEIKGIAAAAEAEAKKNGEQAAAIRSNAQDLIASKNAEFAINEKLREQEDQRAKESQFRVRDPGLERGENRLLTGTLAAGLRETIAGEAKADPKRDPAALAQAALEEAKKQTAGNAKMASTLDQMLNWLKSNPGSGGRPMSN